MRRRSPSHGGGSAVPDERKGCTLQQLPGTGSEQRAAKPATRWQSGPLPVCKSSGSAARFLCHEPMETSLQQALQSDNTEAVDAVLLAALQDKEQRWRQEGASRTRRLELLVEVWERSAGRTASLAASVLALLVRNGSADVNASTTTRYDVSLARRLLYEHGGRMQRMLGSGHDGEVAGALRILAAVAEIGGGFAREALAVLYGVQRVLLELLRSQRHRRERKRRLDGTRRTSMTEHALVHLMVSTVRASGSLVEGVREYDLLFAELLVNVMRCEAPNEALQLVEALSVCPRLASPRNLSVSLANTPGRGERWQELLAQAIAHSKDSAGVGGMLATLRMGVAGRFAVTRQALRLAPPRLLRAYLEQLADRLPRPDLSERERTMQAHAALATEAWMRVAEDADAILLPTLPLNPFTCNMYLAALGRCPHRPPPLSLSAVIEYVRVEAARASVTLGSLRLARALRLLHPQRAVGCIFRLSVHCARADAHAARWPATESRPETGDAAAGSVAAAPRAACRTVRLSHRLPGGTRLVGECPSRRVVCGGGRPVAGPGGGSSPDGTGGLGAGGDPGRRQTVFAGGRGTPVCGGLVSERRGAHAFRFLLILFVSHCANGDGGGSVGGIACRGAGANIATRVGAGDDYRRRHHTTTGHQSHCRARATGVSAGAGCARMGAVGCAGHRHPRPVDRRRTRAFAGVRHPGDGARTTVGGARVSRTPSADGAVGSAAQLDRHPAATHTACGGGVVPASGASGDSAGARLVPSRQLPGDDPTELADRTASTVRR
eukprot:ctg_1066.g220